MVTCQHSSKWLSECIERTFELIVSLVNDRVKYRLITSTIKVTIFCDDTVLFGNTKWSVEPAASLSSTRNMKATVYTERLATVYRKARPHIQRDRNMVLIFVTVKTWNLTYTVTTVMSRFIISVDPADIYSRNNTCSLGLQRN